MPDEFYFVDSSKEFPIGYAIRVTVQCVARWSNRYVAAGVGGGESQRVGTIPPGSIDRSALIDDLIDWAGETIGEKRFRIALSLFLGDVPLFDQSDGSPGTLALTPSEFADLQSCWVDSSLPHDLYYRADRQHAVAEPVQVFGGVVRMVQRYSPLRWINREPTKSSDLTVPSDDERRRRFKEDCWDFHEAVMRRYLEATEPGQQPNKEFITQLQRIEVAVRKIMSAEADS